MKNLKKIIIVCVASLGLVGLFLSIPKDEEPKPSFQTQESDIIYRDENIRKYIGKPEYGRYGGSQTIFIDRKPFGSLDSKVIRYYNQNGNFIDNEETKELFPDDYSNFGRVEERARINHMILFKEKFR